MILYVWPSVSGLTDKIILPGLPAVCDGLFHSWIGRSDTAFRLRLKGTAKKKNRQTPVKAPLWHKHKRNGPCITPKLLFRRDAKPFSPLMRQSAYVRSKSFCTMVCRRIKSLLRKNLYEKKKIREIHFKISRFIVTFAYEEFFEGYATRRRMMQ